MVIIAWISTTQDHQIPGKGIVDEPDWPTDMSTKAIHKPRQASGQDDLQTS